MSTARDVTGAEFWQPPMEMNRVDTPVETNASACERCGTSYVVGSRFCHVCGSEREPQLSRPRFQVSRWLDIHRLQEALGLTLGSLIAFIIGVICTLAAIGTGLIFTANTVLDWQAVQIWRVEWLLAAIAALVAGILLKRAVQ
ncbi:MAG: hypothetical protein JO187_01090 [Acidobacteria bacterium]|nr:hypothetical protein [Acidobacteriota bacterium]